MALAIVVVLVIMMHWFTSMVEKPEPDNQELVDLDPSVSFLSSAESSSARLQKHDVFLSFRGVDTRHDFISHLYHELQNVRGIQTFMDDKGLEIGDPISPSLPKAIEESNFAVVVFSENYASSPWCLEELTKIW